jgi:hypothetical protein
VPPTGVEIADRWQVRFNATGSLGGQVGEQSLAVTTKTDAQYR